MFRCAVKKLLTYSIRFCLVFTCAYMYAIHQYMFLYCVCDAGSDDRKSHTVGNKYSCSECDKSFFSRDVLRQHKNIHTDKYKCTECGKRCQCSADLAAHRRRHSGEKPFECFVCSKRFTRSEHLAAHTRIHSGEKPFKCSTCDKEYRHLSSLNDHMRDHTGYKPYKCSLCKKSFARYHQLRDHKCRFDSNRSPDHCFDCGMLFKTKGQLKRHVHIHTGAKPYLCRHCSYCFRRLDQLKRHLLKSHNEGTCT